MAKEKEQKVDKKQEKIKDKDKKGSKQEPTISDEEVLGKDYEPKLKKFYQTEVAPKLMKDYSYKNIMQVPIVKKVIVNMGLGKATENAKIIDTAIEELRQITGQKPVVTKAKKAIASFKLKKGASIGCMVTLRRDIMWEFLDRLISLAIPRVRDFRGLSTKSFDGRGNYTLGVKEQIIFPEIDYDKIERIVGMNIVLVTSAKTDEEGLGLLKALGMPFKN